VTIHDLLSQLIVNTKGTPGGGPFGFTLDSSLWAFMPELILCATIVLMLVVRLFRWGQRIDGFYFALAGGLLALVCAAPWTHLLPGMGPAADNPFAVTRMEIFTGMLVYDSFSVFVRSLLLTFLVVLALLAKLSGLTNRESSPDVYTLIMGATLGMCLMASANHLLMVFLAVEMASVPSYVLAGLLRGRRTSSEAALKYSVYGAGAAGVMLYGISLAAGLLHTAHLPTMAQQLSLRLPDMIAHEPGSVMVLALAGLLIMVGLAFKLSAVPFHFWCPDVFEGATAEVNAFLSVASKGAALALLVRVVIGFSVIVPHGVAPGERTAARETAGEVARIDGAAERETASGVAAGEKTDTEEKSPVSFVSLAQQGDAAADSPTESDTTDNGQLTTDKEPAESASTANSDAPAVSSSSLAPVRDFLAKLVAFLAVITCTFGNLAAYGQTNIKRLMAYSTIAHAGYMMMAIPALLAAAGVDPAVGQKAVSALCIYLGVYLFMNLGAFAVIAFLRNAMGSEEISDYAGLIYRCPLTVISLSIILLSLIGLPPLAGFIGKFAVFAALVDSYRATAAAGTPQFYLLAVLLIGGINTAISLFYYLRVVKTMTMDPEPRERRPIAFSDVSLQGAYVWLFGALPTVVLFFAWNQLSELANAAARHLLH